MISGKEEEETYVFCKRWTLTTNHELSSDPNYMLTFRNTTSSALRKSLASPTAVNTNMLHKLPCQIFYFFLHDAPRGFACQCNVKSTFMLVFFDSVSALAIQKWIQYLHKVVSAEKSGISFFHEHSNNVSFHGGFKYVKLIKGLLQLAETTTG